MIVPEIDVGELARRRAAGAVLVDVREPDEWVEVRVPGVQLVPLATVADRIDQIPVQGPVHVICRSGSRSLRAAEFLRENGIDAVNVAGGTLAWIEAGYDVESGA